MTLTNNCNFLFSSFNVDFFSKVLNDVYASDFMEKISCIISFLLELFVVNSNFFYQKIKKKHIDMSPSNPKIHQLLLL